MTVIINLEDAIKNKKDQKRKKQDPKKLCVELTAKLLTTAYKPKVLRFKLDEYPLQHLIYFLTFVESLVIIFSQYKETCEVLIYCLTIRVCDITDYAKKTIRNILHTNIDFHGRILIA